MPLYDERNGKPIGSMSQSEEIVNFWRKGTTSDPALRSYANGNGKRGQKYAVPPQFVDYRNLNFASLMETSKARKDFPNRDSGENSIKRVGRRLGMAGSKSRIRGRVDGMGLLRDTGGITAGDAPNVGLFRDTGGITSGPVPNVGDYVEFPPNQMGQSYDLGYQLPDPYAGRGQYSYGLGELPAEAQLWMRKLDDLTKRIKNFQGGVWGFLATSASEEREVYNALGNLMVEGRSVLSGVYAQAPEMILSEMNRWYEERQKALTGSGENDKPISKIREWMLDVINRARTVMGLAPVNVDSPYLFTAEQAREIAQQQQQTPTNVPPMSAPSSTGVQTLATKKPAVEPRTLLMVGAGLAALAGVFYYMKSR